MASEETIDLKEVRKKIDTLFQTQRYLKTKFEEQTNAIEQEQYMELKYVYESMNSGDALIKFFIQNIGWLIAHCSLDNDTRLVEYYETRWDSNIDLERKNMGMNKILRKFFKCINTSFLSPDNFINRFTDYTENFIEIYSFEEVNGFVADSEHIKQRTGTTEIESCDGYAEYPTIPHEIIVEIARDVASKSDFIVSNMERYIAENFDNFDVATIDLTMESTWKNRGGDASAN